MTDRNGDGFLGSFKGTYVLNKKRKDLSYITVEALFFLLLISVVTILILTLLAYSNNKIGTEALQTIVAGKR